MNTSNDKWLAAVATLTEDDKRLLNFDDTNPDRLAVLTDVLTLVDAKKNICINNRWRYKRKNGQIIILRDVFEKVAVWVNKFKEIGDVAVQYDPTHAALPWAGIRFLLNIMTNDLDTFGAMSQAIEQMANAIAYYAIIEILYDKPSTSGLEELTDSLIKAYASVLEFLAKARRYLERSTSKRVALSVVQPVETMVQENLDKFYNNERLVGKWLQVWDRSTQTNIYHMAQDLHRLGESQSMDVGNLRRLLTSLHEPITRLAQETQALYVALQKQERGRFLRWLSNIPNKQHHAAMATNRLDGSGKWLLENTEFAYWLGSSSSSILWLHGIPGSGKSKLVSIVIDHLRITVCRGPNAAPLAYFYCARSTSESNRADPSEIARNILKQLATAGPDQRVNKTVKEVYDKANQEAEDDGLALTSLRLDDAIKAIIEVSRNDPIFLVLDALDECDPRCRHELLKGLDDIIQRSPNLVKIFASSRDDGDIFCRLASSPNIFIRSTDNQGDILAFIKEELDRAIAEKRLLSGNVPDDLRSYIIEKLQDGADGM